MRNITTVEMAWSGVPYSTITTDRPEDFIKKLRMLAGRMGPPDDIRVSTREIIRVLVDRSFGSAHYFWDYPGRLEDLEADWIAGKAPLNFYNIGWNSAQFKGAIKEIPCRPADSEYDCYAHVHGTDDTYLWSPDGRRAIAPDGWRSARPAEEESGLAE